MYFRTNVVGTPSSEEVALERGRLAAVIAGSEVSVPV